LALRLLSPRFNQRQTSAPSVAGRQGGEQQAQTCQRRADLKPRFAGDHDRGGHDGRHGSGDEQRAKATPLQPDGVQDDHDDADRRDVRMEHGQARQEPGRDCDEGAKRVAATHDQGQRCEAGKDDRGSVQVAAVPAKAGIGQQGNEGDQRPGDVDLWRLPHGAQHLRRTA